MIGEQNRKNAVIILAPIMSLVLIAMFGQYFIAKVLDYSSYDIRFPLTEVRSDNADYVLTKYAPDGIYVIDDDEFLSKHRYDTVVFYRSWLEHTTGDGYFLVTRNGEVIFTCAFVNDDYFDKFIRDKYIKYDTLEEFTEQSRE